MNRFHYKEIYELVLKQVLIEHIVSSGMELMVNSIQYKQVIVLARVVLSLL